MKNLKRIFALTFSVIILAINFSFLNTNTVEADTMRYGEVVMSQLANSAEYEFVYNLLLDGFKNRKTTISLTHDRYEICEQELNVAYELLINDYPEIFWIDTLHPYSYSFPENNPNKISSVKPNYKDNIYTNKSLLDSKVKSLTSGLSGKSDYDKALILHNRLAENTVYATTENDQTAYGALVEGKAVCAGYSRAYQLLLQEAGVTAWSVIGKSKIPDNPQAEKIDHEWNIIKINNNWYHTDVTWDDQGENIFYAYFNLTTDQIENDHEITLFKEYLPNCNSNEENYFKKNDLIYSSVDVNRIGDKLKEGNLTTRIYVTSDLNSFIENLGYKISAIVQRAGLPNGYSYTVEPLHLLSNEIILSVNFVDPNHIHKTTYVKKVEPSCISKGCKEYYKCDCGDWFKDSSAKQRITDKSSLILPTTDHISSEYKSNARSHFKECTKCGIIINGTEKSHTDNNSDHKCDVCKYSLPKPQVTSTTNSESQSTQSNTTTTASQLTSSDSSQESDISNETTSLKENNSSSVISKKSNEKSSFNKKLIIPIIAGSVILIGGGIGTTIFFIKRK